jgi:hypothetical protein
MRCESPSGPVYCSMHWFKREVIRAYAIEHAFKLVIYAYSNLQFS